MITAPISEKYLPERAEGERDWVASHRTLDWLNATEREKRPGETTGTVVYHHMRSLTERD